MREAVGYRDASRLNNMSLLRNIQGVCEILCFFQEFSRVCHLSLASTRLLLVVQISQWKRLYTRIALRALKVSCKEGGVAVNCEKTHFFQNTLYLTTQPFSSTSWIGALDPSWATQLRTIMSNLFSSS